MPRRRYLVVLTSLLSLFVLSAIFYAFQRREITREKTIYNHIAEKQAFHIVSTIDRVMTRTETLKEMVRDHHGDTMFFDEMAGTIYDSVISGTGIALKNLAIAPNGVVSKVYPYKGNEGLIGFSFFDPDRPGNAKAIEAYERGDTVLTNPFPLVQGGVGIAGRTPVVLKEIDGNRLWGLVTVTMDFNNLLRSLNLDHLLGMGISYELAYIDDDGSRQVMQSRGVTGDSAVVYRFACRNLLWEISVMPEDGWIPTRRYAYNITIIIILSVLVGVLCDMVLRLRDSNEELLRVSIMDKLTDCLNRRAYETDMEKLGEKEPDEDFVYASIDVNGLKAINDSLGHAAGDELLCGAADCLRTCFADFGKLYRTGGDEFAALFHANGEQLAAIGKKLAEISGKWKGKQVKSLSFSVGFAERREFPELSVVEMAKEADKKMYLAKQEYYRQKGVDRRGRKI